MPTLNDYFEAFLYFLGIRLLFDTISILYYIPSAIEDDDEQRVEHLLDRGYRVNYIEPENKMSPLHYAVQKGNLRIVKLLVERGGANLDERTRGAKTALHIAVNLDKIDVCKYLIDKGANTNAKDAEGYSPFLFACIQASSVEVLNMMIQRGADVNATGGDGRSALHLINGERANNNNRREFCKILIENGSQVNVRDESNWTPLHSAVFHKRLDVCELLVANGADTRAKTDVGSCPLYLAVEFDQHDIFELLLDNGADVNDQNDYKMTPLHLAAQQDNVILSKSLLFNYNADPKLRDDHGLTCLHRAANHGRNSIVSLILKSTRADPIDVNAMCDGTTALHLAVFDGHRSVAMTLLDHGAEYNKCTMSPIFGIMNSVEIAKRRHQREIVTLMKLIGRLLKAAEDNDAPLVRSLIDKSAVVNAKDCQSAGRSALHHAVLNGNVELVEYLLSKQARPDLVTHEGHTCLHLCFVSKNYRIASILIADAQSRLGPIGLMRFLDAKSFHEGDTALHMATRLGQLDSVKLLIRSGAMYNVKNASKATPLDLARGAVKDYLIVVRDVFKHTISGENQRVSECIAREPSVVNARDQIGGGSTLYWAIEKGHADVARTLLDRGADVRLVTRKGNTALHIASHTGNAEIIDDLVLRCPEREKKRFVNFKTLSKKNSALHLAKNVDVARRLLKNGACFNDKNSSGKTPADVHKDVQILELLKMIGRLYDKVNYGTMNRKERRAIGQSDWQALEGSSKYWSCIAAHRCINSPATLQKLNKSDRESVRMIVEDQS